VLLLRFAFRFTRLTLASPRLLLAHMYTQVEANHALAEQIAFEMKAGASETRIAALIAMAKVPFPFPLQLRCTPPLTSVLSANMLVSGLHFVSTFTLPPSGPFVCACVCIWIVVRSPAVPFARHCHSRSTQRR
jgi:hypothetical protein